MIVVSYQFFLSAMSSPRFNRKKVLGSTTVILMSIIIVFVSCYVIFLHSNIHSSSTDEIYTELRKPKLRRNEPMVIKYLFNSTQELEKLRTYIEEEKNIIKNMRQSKIVISRDESAIQHTDRLKNLTRCYLLLQYGPPPYIVEMKLQFPKVMIDRLDTLKDTNGQKVIVIELAPLEYIPYAVYTFLEIVRSFKGGDFSRNAHHVLQAEIRAHFRGGMVYMEYDRRYPHVKHTLGFAGRGGGNAIYINTVDNSVSHGPGTDRGGKDPEADTNFGKIVHGNDIVYLMQKQTGSKNGNGFIDGKENFIQILSLSLTTPVSVDFLNGNNPAYSRCLYSY